MSLYQKASLVQIPSGYKASSANLYSVVPNSGDGDFTVSVAAGATRVNKDGLIESVAANQARLNYDPTNPQDPHLLLEPTRINRVYPNNSLTGYSTIGVSTTNNSATSPNGANEGAKVQATTSGTAVVFRGFTGTSGVTHNISVFAKAGTHNQVRLQEGFSSSRIDVNLSNGTEVSSQNATNKKIEEYPNGWYRISFNFTSSGTNLQFAVYFNGTYSSGENIYLYGGQIEEGSYATSLIPTTASAVTRTFDSCLNGGDANLFNDSEGVLFVDLQGLADVDATNRYITLSDGTATNSIMIQYRNSGDLRLYNGGTGSANLILSIAADLTERKKIAIQYGTTANNYKVYINGASQTISGSFSATSMSGLDRFRFDYVVDNLEFFGKVYQAMVFNEALTDAELITLTT